MALKRQHDMMATFSMASMTDIVFLLLIFFMVTSTYVFPTALEVNLPKSTEQTTLKPVIRIYIDAEGGIATVKGDGQPQPMGAQELETWLKLAIDQEEETPAVALYADESVPYGNVVDILNVGARTNIKMVLATKPTSHPTPSDTPIPAEADVAATSSTSPE